MSDWPIFLLGAFVTAIVAFAVWSTSKTEADVFGDSAQAKDRVTAE